MLIFVTVVAFNFVGDGLQDALDPRARNRQSERV
jgi:peptide/nickel transport system permease protein